MSKYSDQIKKWDIRLDYLARRERISQDRRIEAKERFISSIKDLISPHEVILSFCPTGSELDLSSFNEWVINTKRLILPRVEGEGLGLYQLKSLQNSLVKSSWGIYEPIPDKCERIRPVEVDCILVPGIVFDEDKHRLGYGKGHYDRLLPQCEKAMKIGVGFLEQSYPGKLPSAEHDYKLDLICLY